MLGDLGNDVGDHDVGGRTDRQRNLFVNQSLGQCGIVEESKAVVDSFATAVLYRNFNVFGWSVLAGMHRPPKSEPGRLEERRHEVSVVDPTFNRISPHADQEVSIGFCCRELHHLHVVGGAAWLVDIEDHPAFNVQVVACVLDSCRHSSPDGLHRHTEPDGEPGREEHLPVSDTRPHAILQGFVGDPPIVVGGAETATDHVIDLEELVQAGEAKQFRRVVDG